MQRSGITAAGRCLAPAALALLLLVVSGGCTRPPGVRWVDGLAGMVPGDALTFLGADLRQTADWDQLLEGFEAAKDKPASTGDSFRGISYLAAGLQSDGGKVPVALLGAKNDGPLGAKLFTSPKSSTSLAGMVPTDWSFYMMTHMGYHMGLLIELARSRPEGESAYKDPVADFEDMGLTHLEQAFTGDFALAMDSSDYFNGIPAEPPNTLLMFGVKDLPQAEKALKALYQGDGAQPKLETREHLRLYSVESEPYSLWVFRSPNRWPC